MSLAALFVAVSGPAFAGDLNVTVKNIKSEKGQVIARIYAKSENWLKTEFMRATPSAKAGEVSFVFKALPPGDYAISVFHDEDGDGKLSANFMHIPTEPYGFSNDAKGSFGPPEYAAAKFEMTDAAKSTTITLH